MTVTQRVPRIEDTMSSSFRVRFRVSHHAASTHTAQEINNTQSINNQSSFASTFRRTSTEKSYASMDCAGNSPGGLTQYPSTFARAQECFTHSVKVVHGMLRIYPGVQTFLPFISAGLLSQVCKECASRMMEGHLI